jgi:subtilisin family serine protease
MKKSFNFLILGFLIGGLVLGIAGYLVSQAAPEPMARKIVVFKSGVLNKPAREALVKKFGGVKIKDLTLIDGKAVLLPPKAEAALAKQAGVLRIDDDMVVEALVKRENINELEELMRPSYIKVFGTPKPQPLEVLPWGIDRIDADLTWGQTTGDPIRVAIIDTGIDVKHPDLMDNLKGGVSTVWYTTSYNDDNGHGTHVAGIVGAIDNTIGVIGVGPKIDLYAVKVLDRRGSGYLSDVIEGLDWAIANGMQVVNMSLGTSVYSESFEEAMKKVNKAGIVQAAAAGNSGPDDNTVLYPAKFSEVIAVSATDGSDTIAFWSSRGPEIDLAAPGVSIYSTYKGQTYKTLSGTSMAAPHVTGAAALVIDKKTCDYNSDGICSPAEVQQRLEAMAEDLGAVGKDNLYGAGLVDAEKAVMQ